MPLAVPEPPSPSASSLFLPLGLRARRDSKASLSAAIDPEALNEALDTIHNTASQSQHLTVFNDYTKPPPASSKPENRTLATDIQGGLSGLYSKLKASVGVSKEGVDIHEVQHGDSDSRKSGSKPSSVATSQLQSPRELAFESFHGSEGPPSSSRHASRVSAAPPKIPPSTAPLIKSPIIPSQPSAHALGPTVTELNIHASTKSTDHSRQGSNLDPQDFQYEPASGEDESLRRVLSARNTVDEPFRSRVERHLASPGLRPSEGAIALRRAVSHERGASRTSIASQMSKASAKVPDILKKDQLESNLSPTSKKQDVDWISASVTSPMVRDQERALQSPQPLTQGEDPSADRSAQESPTQARPRPIDKLRPPVSQSKLPGFHGSSASSTDSRLTPTLSEPQRPRVTADTAAEPLSKLRSGPSKLRSRLLSKDFWMKDENARDCFHCGEPFTTFRRKHHCRTCGQIFDNKCTVLVKGAQFGSTGMVRVCRPCEAIITSHDDDSSDFSADDISIAESQARPRTPDTAQLLRNAARFDDDNASMVSQTLEQMSRTPTMGLPVRRAYDETKRSSAILEFEATDRPLPRPSSSRSLRASHSIGHGHKRHHSRHQHIRNFKAYHEDRAPFQKRSVEDPVKELKASAFHQDSVIDPDLAQYLSDEASSDEDYSAGQLMDQDKLSRSVPETERTTLGGLLAAMRKGRSRIGDRSIAGLLGGSRDVDNVSIINSQRPSRKRNLSIASSVHQKLTPKSTKERLYNHYPAATEASLADYGQPILNRVSRMTRSASMQGIEAPALELNRASLRHVHRLLQQLLKDAHIERPASWESALVPILLRVTDDVDPDVHSGDDMDIRHYVKLKKIPGSKPSDTAYVSGLVFTKNIALKSMSRSILRPQILVITFPLEYTRYEQHFMSLDPVIRQEREYLENLVSRIAALKPDVLLAQRNISGLALELLDKAGITVVFNVKPSVLEAISRCTLTRVVHSMDKLTAKHVQLGTCASFEVKTFVGEGRKRTYIYITGCPPQLGCTIALRGADRKILAKIKRITEFMIYVVYNLKLETCLMRDEWALVPNSSEHKLNDQHEGQDGKVGAANSQDATAKSADQHSLSIAHEKPHDGAATSRTDDSTPGELSHPQAFRMDSVESVPIPDDVPVPTFYEDMVEKHETKILSASPFVKFMQPYLLMRSRELERRVAYLKRLRDQDLSVDTSQDEKAKAQKFTLIQPEMLHNPLADTSKKVREIIHAVHDTEYDKAFHNYQTQKKQWEAYLSGNSNLFDPYAHQNIVVLFSLVSTSTSVPCSGPDLLAFSFYNEHEHEKEFEADCTLGQYVEDLCYRANDLCPSQACEKRFSEHHRHYVLGEAQITVSVQPHPAKMRGLEDIILMWSQCRICGTDTTVTPMSASTWKYSFGKYLELSFWSADLHARASTCQHDLHRQHMRFFGYKDFALSVQYDPIQLLEIIVPRLRITWKVDNDLRFRNEAYTRIEHRVTRFMGSVKLRLKSINIEALPLESAEACRAEIEALTKKANEDHTYLIKGLQERYSNSRHWQIIPLNRAIRLTQEKVAEWDNAFLEFEKNFFPSERDIRRLATLQLKKIFLDRDVSVTSLESRDDDSNTVNAPEFNDEKAMEKAGSIERPQPRRSATLSPEKTQSVLQSVLEENTPAEKPEVEDIAVVDEHLEEQPVSEKPDMSNLLKLPGTLRDTDVRHLDLALSDRNIHDLSAPKDATVQNSRDQTSPRPSEVSLQNQVVVGSEEPQTRPNMSVLKGTTTTAVPIILRLDAQLGIINQPQEQLGSTSVSPKLLRAHSQPAGTMTIKRDPAFGGQSTLSAINAINGFGTNSGRTAVVSPTPSQEEFGLSTERKLSERLGLAHLKASKFMKGHSLIPRAVPNKKESRVSNLAKHFEQLSREFERERIRERRQRAARNRQSRVYPLPASKPIVEIYKNVNEAVEEVEEKNTSDEVADLEDQTAVDLGASQTTEGLAQTQSTLSSGQGLPTEEPGTEVTETEGDVQLSSHAASEIEESSGDEDEVDSVEIFLPDSPEDLLRLSQEDLDLKELPKHERTSLMKMLTNFWAERSSSGWAALEYPLGASEHIFADCDILVREDEPSSVIAFALDSQDYKSMIQDIQQHPAEGDSNVNTGDAQADLMHSMLRKRGTHLKYQFNEGPARMVCKIFFAEQFDAVRRKCGVADRIVESLSRCMKWDSKGGKTKSLFLKTLDDRFVLKSLSPIETQSFLKFAPNYFQIMSEAFFHELPSVIAKMLGFYQIIVKNPATGVEYNWYLLIMENLFYDRIPTRIFDLKGSMRNRKIEATGEKNEVLLDENMVEFIYESPLFAREHSKKLLRSSVHNDTLFLARQNVMDYSLMMAIDETRKELVVGIIDCIRTYTWDKKLESWIKDRGFGGGGKNRPTVTSPKEYKRRFREAMGRYVLEAPDCWHQFKPDNMVKRLVKINTADGGEKDEKDIQTLT